MTDARTQIIVLLPRLRRFARALCGSARRADDLVRAACERALRDGWPAEMRADSGMLQILHRLWRDAPRPADDVRDGQAPLTLESRRAGARMRALVLALPEPQREVLALVSIESMGYRDAAAILGLPVGTVLSRLSQARRALEAAGAGDAA